MFFYFFIFLQKAGFVHEAAQWCQVVTCYWAKPLLNAMLLKTKFMHDHNPEQLERPKTPAGHRMLFLLEFDIKM